MMRGSGRPGDPLQPSQEYNDAYDAEQDAKLKSIKHYKPPVIVTPVDDTSDHFLVGDLASDAISSRVHAWLERYDISPHPGDTTKYPALYFSISVNDCKCGSSLVSVHLSVLDDVALQRNPTIAFRTNIWDKTEKVMVNKDNSHDEISSAITHVLDQFSLAYLAGTR